MKFNIKYKYFGDPPFCFRGPVPGHETHCLGNAGLEDSTGYTSVLNTIIGITSKEEQ